MDVLSLIYFYQWFLLTYKTYRRVYSALTFIWNSIFVRITYVAFPRYLSFHSHTLQELVWRCSLFTHLITDVLSVVFQVLLLQMVQSRTNLYVPFGHVHLHIYCVFSSSALTDSQAISIFSFSSLLSRSLSFFPPPPPLLSTFFSLSLAVSFKILFW